MSQTGVETMQEWTPAMVGTMIDLAGERSAKVHRRGPMDFMSWRHAVPGVQVEVIGVRRLGHPSWSYRVRTFPYSEIAPETEPDTGAQPLRRPPQSLDDLAAVHEIVANILNAPMTVG